MKFDESAHKAETRYNRSTGTSPATSLESEFTMKTDSLIAVLAAIHATSSQVRQATDHAAQRAAERAACNAEGRIRNAMAQAADLGLIASPRMGGF